jgi:hypothetical protein
MNICNYNKLIPTLILKSDHTKDKVKPWVWMVAHRRAAIEPKMAG